MENMVKIDIDNVAVWLTAPLHASFSQRSQETCSLLLFVDMIFSDAHMLLASDVNEHPLI